MLAFILNIVLMLALGTILFLVVRALPRIEESEEKKVKRGIFERWLVSDLPERMDLYFSNLFAKWLRRLRVFVMKLDNTLGHHLKKIKPHSNGKSEGNGGFEDMRDGD